MSVSSIGETEVNDDASMSLGRYNQIGRGSKREVSDIWALVETE
jgi:hypothetical protein